MPRGRVAVAPGSLRPRREPTASQRSSGGRLRRSRATRLLHAATHSADVETVANMSGSQAPSDNYWAEPGGGAIFGHPSITRDDQHCQHLYLYLERIRVHSSAPLCRLDRYRRAQQPASYGFPSNQLRTAQFSCRVRPCCSEALAGLGQPLPCCEQGAGRSARSRRRRRSPGGTAASIRTCPSRLRGS